MPLMLLIWLLLTAGVRGFVFTGFGRDELELLFTFVLDEILIFGRFVGLGFGCGLVFFCAFGFGADRGGRGLMFGLGRGWGGRGWTCCLGRG